MAEHMGPGIASCPARILDLLTATDSKYAIQWRAECRERLERRQANKLKVSYYIRFAEPLSYEDGHIGGRCMAWRKDESDETNLLITRNHSGMYGDHKVRNWGVGRYSDNHIGFISIVGDEGQSLTLRKLLRQSTACPADGGLGQLRHSREALAAAAGPNPR
jgi:hypothetical protein